MQSGAGQDAMNMTKLCQVGLIFALQKTDLASIQTSIQNLMIY
jgi:hypothetical protein